MNIVSVISTVETAAVGAAVTVRAGVAAGAAGSGVVCHLNR